MEPKKTIFHYINQTIIIFGITILILNVFCYFVGDDAREYSTIFSLGSQGISITTTMQFLLISVLITALRFLLFCDGLISRISLAIRTFLMFFSVALMTSVFAWLFGWFPVNMLEAWGCFFACFGFCSFASAYIMAFKTDRENKQLEEALKKLKEEEEGNA